jgi:hypothetical protein
MTPQTALELKFADGDYLFDLKLPQLAELQRVRDCGIFKIYGRVLKGRFMLGENPVVLPEDGEAFVEDLYETIRLGLIGGGKGDVNGQEAPVSAIRARQLVETYCHPAPLTESWSLAAAILAARIHGFNPPTDKKKAPQGRERKPRSSSTSRRSRTTAESSTATTTP